VGEPLGHCLRDSRNECIISDEFPVEPLIAKGSNMETNGLLLGRFGKPHSEQGFGMIEVMVSLFLLSILSLSFIPVLINAVKTSGANTTMATATQIVNQQLEGARAVRSATATSPSCLDITKFLQVTLAPVIDPRGVSLQPQWAATSCPVTYPGVVRVSVSVTTIGKTNPIAAATTLVFVNSAT
jgi:prepilin-type N-terminal cleavage/methylation domain-containing protein